MVSINRSISKSSTILQFAKTPQPGKVKTRLLPVLTPDQAAILHQNLLTHVANVAAQVEGVSHQLWSTAGGEFIESLANQNSSAHYLQVGEDLGKRLAYAVEQTIDHTDAVILIGSDCPYLDTAYYLRVTEAICEGDNDLVIGPAHDGGYVLLALGKYYPELFEGIAWGTEKVFEQTIAKAKQLSLKVKCDTILDDIDRPEDLAALRSNLMYQHLLAGL
ncbi:TIGR04282 family arsenosugar biosynthesis glycosyltransferase [Agarilytica rhodophyticola]|uniref:TIGR04282 family arsenosugar biosynthesis glycosyltransferase n=1 Tax=Agarilytica rhodophyticola TaxID=1737490 RepID=UPI000B347DD0|nr:TIGR04282 family arsenosugar biosynthesis glycosyltransferase [Agarilytica rhodophyticola]